MKKFITITIIFTLFLISCGCQADVGEDYSPSSVLINETSKPSVDNINNVIDNTPNEFIAVDSSQISPDDYAEAFRLSEALITQYLETIYMAQEPAFSELIYNNNLLTYLEEKIKISKQLRDAASDLSDIRVDSIEVTESKLYDTYYFFKLEYTHSGATSVCYTLVVNDSGILKVADIYFQMKDGIDTYSTGDIRLERTLDNPEIWKEDKWYHNVIDKLSNFKSEVESPMYNY